MVSIRQAAQSGARWVELDVNVSADGVLYLHHDDTLNRCTNGTGYLIQHTSDYLDTLDAGSWFNERFAGEPLARLSDTVALLSELKMGVNLEVKPSAGWELPLADTLIEFVQNDWPDDVPLLLSSFSEKCLARVQPELEDTSLGLIVCAIPDDYRSIMRSTGCQTLHCAGELVTESLARQIINDGIRLLCWTVNSTKQRDQLLGWGVTSVITDSPTTLLT